MKLSNLWGKVMTQELEAEMKELTKDALQTVQLGASATHQRSQRRRQEMKNDLNAAYRVQCSPPEEEAAELFSSKLNDWVCELNEARRMGRQLAETSYARSRPWRRTFLARGRHQYTQGSKALSNTSQYHDQFDDHSLGTDNFLTNG